MKNKSTTLTKLITPELDEAIVKEQSKSYPKKTKQEVVIELLESKLGVKYGKEN